MFARNEDNANALRSSAGYIESGSKFGVRVGDQLSTVGQVVRYHHFSLYEREDLQTCLSHEYPPTQAVVVYVDDTWRKGTMCVAYDRKSHQVRAIEWAYGAFTIEL